MAVDHVFPPHTGFMPGEQGTKKPGTNSGPSEVNGNVSGPQDTALLIFLSRRAIRPALFTGPAEDRMPWGRAEEETEPGKKANPSNGDLNIFLKRILLFHLFLYSIIDKLFFV